MEEFCLTPMYAEDNNDKLILSSDDGTGGKNPLNAYAWTLTHMSFSTDPMNWDPTLDIEVRPLWQYNKSVDIYRCPADHCLVTAADGTQHPRVRTYSMNFFLGGFAGESAAGVSGVGIRAWGNSYPVYFKLQEMANLNASPGAAKTFVFLDERADCINWGNFMTDMSGAPTASNSKGNPSLFEWNEDLPASYHCLACGISFADGHSEIHRWRVPSTMPPFVCGILSGGKGSGQQWIAPYSVDVAWMQDRTARPK